MRVLQVYRTYFPDTQGGGEEVIRTLSRGLVAIGVEVVVLYPSRQVADVDEYVLDGVRVCRVPELMEVASCNVFVRGLGVFRRWARWADVIHYHFPWPFADVLHFLVEPRGRARHVLTYHSDIVRQRWLGRLYAPLMQSFLPRMDRIVATSRAYANSSPVLRAHAGRVQVIPLGLDRERVGTATVERVAAWRARLGGEFFLFVGVLRYYKGLDVLLRAVAGSGLRMVICGDGPERAALQRLARELDSREVVFTGRIEDADKWALMSLARAFVLPSNERSEAFGVALLEAMAFSLPLLTTDLDTGVNFVNQAGETGLCVPANDPLALREAMRRLACDEALCARFGAGAHARLVNELDAARMVDRYAKLYADIVPEPAS